MNRPRILFVKSDLQLGVLHTGRNQRLIDALGCLKTAHKDLIIISCAAGGTFSESLDGLVRGLRTRKLAQAIQKWGPDCVVHVQGFITLGLCALAACKVLRVPMISYLPMTHRVWSLSPSLIALAHDMMNRYWYSLPDAYIVTSKRMQDYLAKLHGVAAASISVAEYGPSLPMKETVDRNEARRRIGVADKHAVGVVGRVEFFQKRQDFLIRAVARHKACLGDYCFLIVGDGPDLFKAKEMVRKSKLESLVHFLPWQSDMSALYPALDVLLIPSRYEGVPLVMLEAMAHRIPVLASAVDGMLDILPEACLFPSGDAVSLVARLQSITHDDKQVVTEMLAQLIETRMNAAVFAETIASSLRSFLQSNSMIR